MASTTRIYELQVKLAQESLQQLKLLQTHAKKSEERLSALSSVAKNFGAGLLAGFSVSQFTSGIANAIDYVDELAASAERLGISVESFSRLQYAAEQSDASLGELTGGLKELQKTIGKMGTTDKGAGILEALGITTEGKSVEQVLSDFADGLKTIQDPIAQTNAIIEVLGKNGLALRPMLSEGSAGLAEFAAEAEHLGLVVGEDTAAKLGELDNTMKKLQGTTQAVFVDIADGLAPSLLRLGDALLDASNSGDSFKQVGEALGTVLTGLGNAAAIVATGFEVAGGNIGAVAAAFAAVLDGEFDQAFDIISMRVDDVGTEFSDLAVTMSELSTTTKAVAGTTAEIAVAEEDLANNTSAVVEVLKRSTEETDKNTKAKKENKKATDEMIPGEEYINALRKDGLSLTKEVRTDQEVLADEFERYNELLNRGAISQETYNRAVWDASEAYTSAGEKADETDTILEGLASRMDGYSSQMADTFIDFAMGADDAAASFEDMAASILADIAKMITQMLIMKPLMDSIGGYFGFAGAAADGKVVDQGKFTPFAKGGVVTGPTLFPMANGAGLMGEAGPEAIMPLSRLSNGKLGVESSGGGAGVVVNVFNESGAEVTTETNSGPNGEQVINIMVQKAVEKAIGAGRFDSTFQTTYGLQRRGY